MSSKQNRLFSPELREVMNHHLGDPTGALFNLLCISDIVKVHQNQAIIGVYRIGTLGIEASGAGTTRPPLKRLY